MKLLRMVLYVLIAVALIAGVWGLWVRLTQGHQGTAYGSYMPWGLWVSFYVYFISLSAGAFLMSALVYVFGVRQFERIGRLALFTALVCLMASILHIWFDLGHMERFWRVFRFPNWTSVMNFMVWTYTVYFLLLLTELFLAMRADVWPFLKRPYGPEQEQRDRRWLRVLGSIGVPLAIAFHGGVGALFGVLGARPYWHVGMYPIMFLIAAVAGGAALLTFLVAFFVPDHENKPMVAILGKLTLAVLLFETLFLFADFFTSLYGALPMNVAAVMSVLTGPYAWAFWGIQVFLGTLVPIVILGHPRLSRNVPVVGFAGLLVAFGFSVARLNLILPALAVPELEQLETAFTGSRLTFSYFPSLSEWALTAGITAFATAVFLIGYRWLPIVTSSVEEA